MENKEIIQLLKKTKYDKKMTMDEISYKAGVGLRTVYRIFAGEDVRFSLLLAVVSALGLSISISKNK